MKFFSVIVYGDTTDYINELGFEFLNRVFVRVWCALVC